MASKVHEEKMERTLLMKGLGKVQEICLTGSKAVKKKERPLGVRMGNEPCRKGEVIRRCKRNRFPRKTPFPRMERGTIADLPDNPAGTDESPQETNAKKRKEESDYKLSFTPPSQRE